MDRTAEELVFALHRYRNLDSFRSQAHERVDNSTHYVKLELATSEAIRRMRSIFPGNVVTGMLSDAGQETMISCTRTFPHLITLNLTREGIKNASQ